MNDYLIRLMKRGCEFLGSSYAILGGAMAWVSEHNLVSAISNAGGFGVLASGAMSPEQLNNEIIKTQAKTSKPFAVNIIVMHPQVEELIKVCSERNVSHVVLAGGIPSTSIIQQTKQFAKILCFVPSLIIARKLIKQGVDALIIEGSEAGGHIGPTSTNILVQEILPYLKEVPVFVAGGIGRGELILSYLEMGAAGCQLGTRFVCSCESIAHPLFKEAFIKAKARDAITSIQLDERFPVIPVRSIKNKATDAFYALQRTVIEEYDRNEIELKDAQLKIEKFWSGALRKAVINGDIENGSIMAGQSVGLVTEEKPVQNIIEELLTQAEQSINNKLSISFNNQQV